MDSRVVLFIVHFLFNGDTSSFQTAPSARKCASSVFGKRTRLFQCKFCRHSLGKLGGVAVVWRDHHRQITNGVSSFLANLTKHRATYLPALLAPEAHVLPKLQPPLFLIRQHISPRALFMQPRPCRRCGRTNELVTPSHLYHPLMGPVAQISQRKKAPHTHVSRLSHFAIPPFSSIYRRLTVLRYSNR